MSRCKWNVKLEGSDGAKKSDRENTAEMKAKEKKNKKRNNEPK